MVEKTTDLPTIDRAPGEHVDERAPLAKVTRGMVRIHSEYFGKGPTRARTDRVGDDGVICVLRDMLTPVEQTLLQRGQSDQVRALRRAFQDAMAPEFRAVVEAALGRTVTAFLSQVSLDPDIAIEMFVLAPEQAAADRLPASVAGAASV